MMEASQMVAQSAVCCPIDLTRVKRWGKGVGQGLTHETFASHGTIETRVMGLTHPVHR